MWHLRAAEADLDILFHTLEDVCTHLLNEAPRMMKYELQFHPIWTPHIPEATASPSDAAPSEKAGFPEFPIPMSHSGD